MKEHFLFWNDALILLCFSCYKNYSFLILGLLNFCDFTGYLRCEIQLGYLKDWWGVENALYYENK